MIARRASLRRREFLQEGIDDEGGGSPDFILLKWKEIDVPDFSFAHHLDDFLVCRIAEEGERHFEDGFNFGSAQLECRDMLNQTYDGRDNKSGWNGYVIKNAQDLDLICSKTNFLFRFAQCSGNDISIQFINGASRKRDLAFVVFNIFRTPSQKKMCLSGLFEDRNEDSGARKGNVRFCRALIVFEKATKLVCEGIHDVQ